MNGDETAHALLRLKGLIEGAEKEKNQLEGRIQQKQQELKETFGVKSLKEARAKLEQLEKELAKEEEMYQEQIAELEELYREATTVDDSGK